MAPEELKIPNFAHNNSGSTPPSGKGGWGVSTHSPVHLGSGGRWTTNIKEDSHDTPNLTETCGALESANQKLGNIGGRKGAMSDHGGSTATWRAGGWGPLSLVLHDAHRPILGGDAEPLHLKPGPTQQGHGKHTKDGARKAGKSRRKSTSVTLWK